MPEGGPAALSGCHGIDVLAATGSLHLHEATRATPCFELKAGSPEIEVGGRTPLKVEQSLPEIVFSSYSRRDRSSGATSG